MDVFESNLYWTTSQTGELIRQDKFGRGVPVRMAGSIGAPGGVRVYHPLRYNESLKDPCQNSECSHLCVAVPRGKRCLCPDDDNSRPSGPETSCDSPKELEKPAPQVCPCQNGGYCRDFPEPGCWCPDKFRGAHCEIGIGFSRAGGPFGAILVPMLVAVLLLLTAAAVFLVIKKRPL